MLKSYIKCPFGKWLIVILISVVVISVLLGFLIYKKGFWANILAGIFGIGISILVALLVVDRYIEYQREQQ